MSQPQAEQDVETLKTVLSAGLVKDYETVYKKINGDATYLSFNARALTNERGEILGAHGIARDITAQKETERALLESQHRYREMVYSSPMGMHFYELREEGLIFIDYNPAADRLLLVDNSQFIGKSIEEAFPPLAETEIPTRYKEVATTGTAWFTEQVVYTDDQITGAFEVHAFQISPHNMVAVFVDITDKKRAEENLKNEKERISVTLRSIGDGVIATDITGRVILMNKVSEALTGWSFADAEQRPLAEVFNIINETTGKPCENPVDAVLRTCSSVELENHTVLIAKDGRQRIIADSGAPIFDSDSSIIGVVLVFRDVTEKSKMRDTIARTQRLESLGILAGGIAHDFNNLLGGIFGYIELAKEVTSEPHVRNYLEKAFFTMNRARGLTQQLLTFAKGGGPILKTISIANLVADSAKFALSGTNVNVRCEFTEGLWQCNVDENQFGQVIDNIVINGQQAMPLGGAICISVKNITIPPGGHHSIKAGDYVNVSISDSGAGIPKENLPLIFDPFFTTKQKGSGLGLVTCYSIVRKHGGSIDVVSELGKGTTVQIYLPAADGDAMGSSIPAPPEKRGSGKVLVMDDEDFLREILGNMLSLLGFAPVCVANGEDAVSAVRAATQGDSFVAAILDLTIPGGMGGQETAQAIHAINPQIPVFVSSGYSEDPVIANPTAFGFVASIIKPFRKNQLCEILCPYLD